MSPGESISPTAHYTGYVWARNGLSHPELSTREGRLLFEALRGVMTVNGALGGGTLEAYLLARHRAIDAVLARVIEEQRVTQVIEVASGLSPRGWRFAQRYGAALMYIETDLPAMAARKREALERIGALSERHQVRELDALRDSGPHSLAAVTADLDRAEGLAIITEGLLGYLPREAVEGIWRRFAAILGEFAPNRYISDLHLRELNNAQVQAFRLLLSAFVRGRVHVHFDDTGQAQDELRRAGFSWAEIRRALDVLAEARDGADPAARRAHILEASTI